jgi:hypothetical protein
VSYYLTFFLHVALLVWRNDADSLRQTINALAVVQQFVQSALTMATEGAICAVAVGLHTTAEDAAAAADTAVSAVGPAAAGSATAVVAAAAASSAAVADVAAQSAAASSAGTARSRIPVPTRLQGTEACHNATS